MNIEVKDILPKLKSLLEILQRYIVFIFILVLLGLFGFLVYKIGTVSSVSPDEEAVAEQLRASQRLKIDQAAIDKILELEDQNIAVKSLFQDARDNPFRED